MDKVKEFVKNHGKTIVVLVLLVVAVILISGGIKIPSCSGSSSSSEENSGGLFSSCTGLSSCSGGLSSCSGLSSCAGGATSSSDVVTVNGWSIPTYDSESAAKDQPIQVAGNFSLSVIAPATRAIIKVGDSTLSSDANGGMTFNITPPVYDSCVAVAITLQNGSGDSLNDKFGRNQSEQTVYFAFIASNTQEAQATSAPVNQTPLPDTTPDPNAEVTAAPAVTTTDAPVGSTAIPTMEPTEEPESVPQVNGTIVYGGVTYNTYASPEESLGTESNAYPNAYSLPTSVASNFELTAIPGDNVSRMNVWVDWASSGSVAHQELFLYDGHWTDVLDLTPYAGQTIIVCLCSQDGGLIPHCYYQYVAFNVPTTVGSINYVDPTSTPEPAETP